MVNQAFASARPGRHVVIVCHPDPASFNHAIADNYCAVVRDLGQEVVLRDLYAIGFDPILRASERPTLPELTLSADIVAELAAVHGGDVFVLIYPIWFGLPPAMLKGYVERVLGAGVDPGAIQSRARSALLGDKRLLSFTTSAASSAWLNEQGQEQSLRDILDRYLVHAFGMAGHAHVHLAGITTGLSERFADQHLHDVAEQARRTCGALAAELHAASGVRSLVARGSF